MIGRGFGRVAEMGLRATLGCQHRWYFYAMKTTIDRAGRIVVPKTLREELSLGPEVEVEVSVVGGHLEIEPVSVPMRLQRRDGRLVAVADTEVPPLSERELRRTLDLVREKR